MSINILIVSWKELAEMIHQDSSQKSCFMGKRKMSRKCKKQKLTAPSNTITCPFNSFDYSATQTHPSGKNSKPEIALRGASRW